MVSTFAPSAIDKYSKWKEKYFSLLNFCLYPDTIATVANQLTKYLNGSNFVSLLKL